MVGGGLIPDAVNVGQVHEEDLRVGIVLGTLHPTATGPAAREAGVCEPHLTHI